MLKVVYIISNLSVGGAETMLLKLMQNIDRTRFHPTVISMTEEGEIGSRLAALGISVHALCMKRGRLPNLLTFFRLIRLVRHSNPEIVHTWMYHADLLGGVAARIAGCSNVIWSIRHSNLSKELNKRSTLITVKLCALLSNLIPSRIISCSNRAKTIHLEVGYRKDKLDVIPNGFELNQFTPDSSAHASVREELGLSYGATLVGMIARFDSQKNHFGFLKAASYVIEHIPNANFVLAGQGVDFTNSELNAEIARLGLNGRVHLLGRREDVPRLMASLDVLSSASHGEAFPNVLGEAMACGVPCVVTDVGDSAEIVGDTGVVVKPGDMIGLAQGLIEVLKMNPEKKALLSKAARVRVADSYEIGHVARQYEKLYENLAMHNKKENTKCAGL